MFTKFNPIKHLHFWTSLLLALTVMGGSLAWAPAALAADSPPNPGGPDDSTDAPVSSQNDPCADTIDEPESYSHPCWTWWWKHYHPTYYAWVVENVLIVQGSHFARHHDIQINARIDRGGWMRLGKADVNHNGQFIVGFRLPARVHHDEWVQVRLVDLNNGVTYHIWAWRAD